MKSLAIILFGVLLSLPAFAQVDFDKLLNKKKLKKSRSITYGYERKWSKFECVSGDCENGEGIYKVKGSFFHLYAKGQFKDGKLNGPGTIYLFNFKANNYSREGFIAELKKGKPSFDYFKKGERCPNEIYEGLFTDNVLSAGTYTYYGKGLYSTRLFQKNTMSYLNSLEPWKDYDSRRDKFYYTFTGNFPIKEYGTVVFELNTANSRVEIDNNVHKTIVTPTTKKNEFLCKKFKNNNLVVTKTLKGIEGKWHIVQTVSTKVVKKRDPNQAVKHHCTNCHGKGEFKRRVWVIVKRERRAGNMGYGKNVITKRTYADYTPGGRKPAIGGSTTAHVEDVMFPCKSCDGKGYTLKK